MLKSIIGQLPVTEKQAEYLHLESHQRISPALEECCLRLIATVSYKNAENDLPKYTGIKVSEKTLQRIVERHQFPEEEVRETIKEISLDGGKVRSLNGDKRRIVRLERLQGDPGR